MTRWFWRRVLRRFTRRERVVGADPTSVVTYDFKNEWIEINITDCWGIEVWVTLRGDEPRQWRWYDAPFWAWFIDHLEDVR